MDLVAQTLNNMRLLAAKVASWSSYGTNIAGAAKQVNTWETIARSHCNENTIPMIPMIPKIEKALWRTFECFGCNATVWHLFIRLGLCYLRIFLFNLTLHCLDFVKDLSKLSRKALKALQPLDECNTPKQCLRSLLLQSGQFILQRTFAATFTSKELHLPTSSVLSISQMRMRPSRDQQLLSLPLPSNDLKISWFHWVIEVSPRQCPLREVQLDAMHHPQTHFDLQLRSVFLDFEDKQTSITSHHQICPEALTRSETKQGRLQSLAKPV